MGWGRRRLLCGAVIGMAALIAKKVASAGDAYLSGVEDLPLMPGLSERRELATVFDSPSGRIVETFAVGAVSPAEVTTFYERTLPQLGWQNEGGGVFRREGERLRLEFPQRPPSGLASAVGGRQLVVRFFLSPF